jgi:dihydrofolate reductase
VIVDLSMSLDGFIAGPDDGPGQPLGQGGEALFEWQSTGPEEISPWLRPVAGSRAIVEEWLADSGALLAGRRTFEIAGGWSAGHPIDAPIFVVTHSVPTSGEWNSRVQFITDGVEPALEAAQKAAGDGVIGVAGSALAEQLLRLRKLDEIQVHVVPLLLGGGVRLFDQLGAGPIRLEQTRVIVSQGVTHLRYRVRY